MKKYTCRILSGLAVGWLVVTASLACTEEPDCSEARRRTVFCEMVTTNEDNEVVKYVLPYIHVSTPIANKDTALLNQASNQSFFSLPLQYAKNETEWVFHYNSNDWTVDTDTIHISHDNTPIFISLACGYSMKQTIKGEVLSTTSRIKKIEIVSSETNQDGKTNLRIYY